MIQGRTGRRFRANFAGRDALDAAQGQYRRPHVVSAPRSGVRAVPAARLVRAGAKFRWNDQAKLAAQNPDHAQLASAVQVVRAAARPRSGVAGAAVRLSDAAAVGRPDRPANAL